MVSNRTDESLETRLIKLTRDLILIPSDVSRPLEIDRAFEFFKYQMDDLPEIEIKMFEKNGCPSMMASPKGISQPEVMFIGHLDVIHHSEDSVYRSKVENGKIIGPGAGDMKGALAIMLEVFAAMHRRYPGISLGILITSDEERGGKNGVEYLFGEEGLRCKVALIPDGGAPDKIIQREKGLIHVTLRGRGNSAHAARPWQGNNPIPLMMQRLLNLQALFDKFKQDGEHWYPTCALTSIRTQNDTINKIPDDVEATLDIRFTSPHSVSSILSEVRKTLGNEIESRVLVSSEPSEFDPDPIFTSALEKHVGKKPELCGEDGGSDGRLIAPYGISVVLCRPLVGRLHSSEEWIDIESMVTFYRVYESYILQKFETGPP